MLSAAKYYLILKLATAELMLLSITAAYLSLTGTEIENSVIVWCQSLGIFSPWPNGVVPSLLALCMPCSVTAAVGAASAKPWAEPVHFTCEK